MNCLILTHKVQMKFVNCSLLIGIGYHSIEAEIGEFINHSWTVSFLDSVREPVAYHLVLGWFWSPKTELEVHVMPELCKYIPCLPSPVLSAHHWKLQHFSFTHIPMLQSNVLHFTYVIYNNTRRRSSEFSTPLEIGVVTPLSVLLSCADPVNQTQCSWMGGFSAQRHFILGIPRLASKWGRCDLLRILQIRNLAQMLSTGLVTKTRFLQ